MLVLGVLGLLFLIDRPGLRTEYFALTPHWDNAPVFTRVGSPQLRDLEDVSGIILSKEIFSIRWRGWICVPHSGTYGFRVAADEASFLRLDGEVLLELDTSVRKRKRTRERYLEAGVHAIELGMAQTGRESRMRLSWNPPIGAAELVPDEVLFARRPVQAFRWLRRLASPLSSLQRQFLGALLVLGALMLWRPSVGREMAGSESSERAIRDPRRDRSRRQARRAALLVTLFVATWLATIPFTTDTLDGDDVRYLDAAFHGKKMAWIVNRYVHIYLLRAFFWLENGDAFRGSRSLWSFLFATTVTALGAAAISLGPGLQLRTLGVALFLLLSQFSLMGSIGAAYPDYTVMMFIAVAMAVYLHGLSRRQSTLWDWHAMALGALTVLAFRSKETGFIIAWLALSFLWHEGRIQVKWFVARMTAWLIGAVLAFCVVMGLDALFLGDLWFGVRPSSYGSLQGMMSVAGTRTHQPASLWLNVLIHGHPRGGGVGFAMRNLWVLVAVAVTIAFVRRKSIELRILYLMPAVYLLMLFVLRPPIFSTRHIWPILPVACMLGGLLAFDCGVEKPRWREFLASRFLVPTFLAVTFVVLVLAPTKSGELDGPTARVLVMSAAALGIALAIAAVVVILRRSDSRLVLLMVCGLIFFGPGLHLTHQSLARHIAAQRGEMTLYPWRAFDAEIRAARPKSIQVSPRLLPRFQMVGKRKTRERLARIFFRRPRLRLFAREDLMLGAPVAVGSRRDSRRWRQQAPKIAGTEVFDRSGQLFLVRPRAVGNHPEPP